MSGFAAIVAGRRTPGVYAWHNATDPGRLRHVAAEAGWRLAYLDGWQRQGLAEVYDALTDELDLPAYFGRNLDALLDCLRDLERTVLVWDGWETMDADERDRLVAVFEQRAREEPGFAALLRGGEPSGLELLD